MASLTLGTWSSLLCLVALVFVATPVASAAAYYSDNRLEVPVHRGGEPVLAQDRKGQIARDGHPGHGGYGGTPYQPDPYYAGGESLLPYILPALAVTGLSLLFPNIVTVNDGKRRRRSAGTGVSEAPVDALSEHMMNIYYAAMESDECIQRIACEVGAASKSLKSDNLTSLISVVGSRTPSKYSKLFEKFKHGMNAEKCEKIGCSLLDQ